MKNKIILGHGYSFGCLKSILIILVIGLLLAITAHAQAKDSVKVHQEISLTADSTSYSNYQAQKQKLVEFIVQKQSEIYEATEALKDAYNKLSQLNIAIQGYEEKFKLYRQMKKEEKRQ